MKRPKLPGDTEPPRELVIVQRLATDKRMQYVWRTLEGRGGASDAATWEFFARACDIPLPVLTVADRDAGIKSLLNVATVCRNRIQTSRRMRDNPTLAKAFAVVADFFETDARDANRMDLRYFVKNHIKNDDARAYVRMLGYETQRLFDATLYGTVATVATIVLGQPIDRQQVRKWCTESGKASCASSGRRKLHPASLGFRK